MPQRRWTAKDERQYEHIRESEEEGGASAAESKGIAARTVNKRRRAEGRTENTRTMGTGNPNRALADRTRDELYNLAREMNVKGRSKMSKNELVTALGDR